MKKGHQSLTGMHHFNFMFIMIGIKERFLNFQNNITTFKTFSASATTSAPTFCNHHQKNTLPDLRIVLPNLAPPAINFSTVSGVAATRRSPGIISLGIPIVKPLNFIVSRTSFMIFHIINW